MSERYVPPPPPYELSIQRDRKVTDDVQTLEALKASPFREEEEWNDFKHSRILSDKPFKDTAVDTLPGIPKFQARADNRARRPLPPRPVDGPLGPRGQGGGFSSNAEINPYATQNYRATERSPVASPSFPVIIPDESSYLHSMHHRSTSVEPTPLYYPQRSLHDTPHRASGDRCVGSSMDPRAETWLRRSSNISLQSLSYPLPQNDNFGARLSFDPSVAYSASQANVQATMSVRRGATPSLYKWVAFHHKRLVLPDDHF